MQFTSTASATTAWNGGVCPTCNARYLGSHTCTREDLARRIAELARLIDEFARLMDERPTFTAKPRDMSGCPCRPQNGGSGVCGCVLGGSVIH